MDRNDLHDPYWARPDDNDPWPGLDFNRELVPPGKNEKFPDGAVGVRIDDDFWSVAALPWDWRKHTIQEIVAALWPSRLAKAEFLADSSND